MAKQVSEKCIECSKTRFLPSKSKPECYKKGACEKKKCYYRRISHYRELLNKNHVYLRFKGDECLTCGSVNKLEVHHIKPQCSGGDSSPENVMTLCRDCHKVISSYDRAVRMKIKHFGE